MKKKFQPDLTSFDPSKKLSAKIASTISQNVAKMLKKICLNLPNSAKMLKKICLKNKIIRNKIWSIKVVKKYLFSNEKKFQPDLTSFDPSKNYLPKSHQQNRPNSAKMLKKLCVINDDVTYCMVEKNW